MAFKRSRAVIPTENGELTAGWLSTPFYVSDCEENSEYQTIFCCMKMNTQQKVCQSERFFV